jgi:hypothetical protein
LKQLQKNRSNVGAMLTLYGLINLLIRYFKNREVKGGEKDEVEKRSF